MLCYVRRRNDLQYEQAETPRISACASDEAYEIHSMVDLRSKGFTISDIEELMGECPDFAEGIEDIIIDMDHKNFSEDYWEQLDDGYDPDAYFEDD